MKKLLIISASIFLLLVVLGCEQALSIGSDSSETQVTVPESGTVSIKSVEPDASHLMVSGVNETGEKLGLRSFESSSTINIDLIPPGKWTFFYNYTDSEGRVISYGQHEVGVKSGRTTRLESNPVKVLHRPGEEGFIGEVLHEWFEPVFDKYNIDSYGRHYSQFIKNTTYYSVHKLLGSSRSLVERKVWLQKNNVDPDKLVMIFVDVMLLFDRGNFMADMINDILAVFQENMYHYFNVEVPYLVNLEIQGLPEDLIIEESEEFSLSADPVLGRTDYAWILNEKESGSGSEWVLNGNDIEIGENRLILQASYRGVLLGQAEGVLVKEEVNTRMLLSNVVFVDNNLRDLVLFSGYTYADEVTKLSVLDLIDVDLTGLEFLTSLKTLYLINTGLTSEQDIKPILALDNLEVLLFRNNFLTTEALNALEDPDTGIPEGCQLIIQ